MKTSTARANGWRCPKCRDETSRDATGRGFVKHKTNRNCDFEKGQRDESDESTAVSSVDRRHSATSSLVRSESSGTQGLNTAKFGEWLSANITDFKPGAASSLYFDHGDSRRSDVAAIKGFFGETVSNSNRLADIDIMIAKPNGEVELLIEIEERDVSPKKILGDVFAVLLCNSFAVRSSGTQRYFHPTANTHLLIAGTAPAKGKRLEKIRTILEPQIHRLEGLPGSVSPQRVELIFARDIEEAITRLKERVCLLLSHYDQFERG